MCICQAYVRACVCVRQDPDAQKCSCHVIVQSAWVVLIITDFAMVVVGVY